MRTLALLCCLAPFAFAAPIPKEVKKDDLARFEGEWWENRFENSEFADAANARRFTFGKKGELAIRQRAGANPDEYSIVIDPTTTPPSFALSTKTGLIYNASYALDADSLRFVLTVPTKPLAKEVKFGAGDVYYELKRVK